MALSTIMAFIMAALTLLTGGVARAVGSTDAKPIMATHREYRFDRDKLLFGAYCLRAKGVELLTPLSDAFRPFLPRLSCRASARRRSLGTKMPR